MSWPLIPLRERDAVAEALGAGRSRAEAAEVPPLLTSALGAVEARLSAATVWRPTVPLGVSWAARWKRLTAVTVDGPYCPSTFTPKPALRRSLLEFADVRAAGAGPQGAVAEDAPRSTLGDRGRCG